MGGKEVALFDYIRKKIPVSSSLVDQISDVLSLSYDASYRRINGKTSLSFNEAYKLIEHFEIPLKNIYELEKDNVITGVRTSNKGTIKGLENYLNNLVKLAEDFFKSKNPSIIYTAKDLPIHHSLELPFSRRFKLFAYTYLLSDESKQKRLKYSDFKVPASLNLLAEKVSTVLKKIPVKEIWNDTTLNSNLYQIGFLHDIKVLSTEEALTICDDFIESVKLIEKRAAKGAVKETSTPFTLYYNKMINLNNILFLTSNNSNRIVMPYTTLSFVTIDDDKMNTEVSAYFEKQLEFSKNLSADTGMERKLFFTGVYDRLNKFRRQIESKYTNTFL